jgi:hypothetical protein
VTGTDDPTAWTGRTESVHDVVGPTPVAGARRDAGTPGPAGLARNPAAAAAALAPRRPRTFDLHPFRVDGRPRGDGTVHLWARDHEGDLAMDATATLR